MKPLIVLSFLFFLSGCAQTQYNWGSYEKNLYNHYCNPAEKAEYLEGLKEIIEDAESSNAKIPPGIFAEYGYTLLESGKTMDSILFFKKESELWPESKFLMKKMILIAEKSNKSVKTAPVKPELK